MLFEIGTIPASSAVGAKAEASISNRTVNGLSVRFEAPATVGKCSLQVELQNSGKENVILIPEMQMFPFVERADVGFGCGYGDTFAEQAVAATGSTPTTDITQLAAYIKLGRINLIDEDKLIVRVKVTTVFAATDAVRVCGVDMGPGPEKILRFIDKPNADASFSDCEEVWVYRTSGDANDQQMTALGLGQVTVNLRTPNGSYNADVRDYWDLTRAVGRIEAEGTRRTAMLYDDSLVTAPGGNVSVTLGGSSSSERANYSILGVERYTDLTRAKRVASAVRAELKARLTKLEGSNPEKLDALILSGQTVSPRAL